ncbi:MAG TPA: four helix bundle protein [Bacteroidota bacterium]|nr:four helix bundle protein [Bacteroidota bacterium]
MSGDKYYDLEERTLRFTKQVVEFLKQVPNTLENTEFSKQLIRSSSSVGANYIEANESLGKKDFLMRVRICKKESKETKYWIELLTCPDGLDNKRKTLIQEAIELMKIFGAILEKSK